MEEVIIFYLIVVVCLGVSLEQMTSSGEFDKSFEESNIGKFMSIDTKSNEFHILIFFISCFWFPILVYGVIKGMFK